MSTEDTDTTESNELWRDESLLRQRYREECRSMAEIAEEFGCSGETISYWVDKYDIVRPWKDESLLRELYIGEKLSLQKVAERTNSSSATVLRWMGKYGIERRSRWDTREKIEDSVDVDEVVSLYVVEGVPVSRIAERYDWSESAISRLLQKNGVDTSGYPTSITELHDPEYLKYHYEEQGRETVDIADELGCHPSTVRKWIRVHDIEARMAGKRFVGEEHPQWKGGHENNYGSNWLKQRRACLERDSNQCVICGLSRQEHMDKWDQDLHVHHIRRKEDFRDESGELDHEAANAPENLITLCRDHHNKWEGIPLRPDVGGAF